MTHAKVTPIDFNNTLFNRVSTSSNTKQLSGGVAYHVIDRANFRSGTVNPVFNRSYRLFVSLPQTPILKISLQRAGALFDGAVGETVSNDSLPHLTLCVSMYIQVVSCQCIDLEDRWWNPSYRSLVDDNLVPIEKR